MMIINALSKQQQARIVIWIAIHGRALDYGMDLKTQTNEQEN